MKKQSNLELKYFENLAKTFQPEYDKIEKEFGNTNPYTLELLQRQYPILSKILK